MFPENIAASFSKSLRNAPTYPDRYDDDYDAVARFLAGTKFEYAHDPVAPKKEASE